MNYRTGRIALSGILTALAFVLVCLGGVVPMLTYAMPALAGAALIPAVAELNAAKAVPVYIVSAALSALLAPGKGAALMYVLFLGYYPILKAVIERLPNKPLRYLLKLLVFNAAVIAGFFIGTRLFFVSSTSLTLAGMYLPGVLLALANVTFLIYDYALSGLVFFYFRRLHPLVHRWLTGRS